MRIVHTAAATSISLRLGGQAYVSHAWLGSLVAYATLQSVLNGCLQGVAGRVRLLDISNRVAERLAVVVALTVRERRSDPLFVVLGNGDGLLDQPLEDAWPVHARRRSAQGNFE